MNSEAIKRLVAVATAEPLARRTFSGLSSNLLSEIQRQGVLIETIATRDIRWYDVLRGAIRWRSLGRPKSRWKSRIDPDWYWSRRTHEQMTSRFFKRLEALPYKSVILQIGTHVRAAGANRRVFCLTDLTVVQAIETGGNYQVTRASDRVRAEAISWQREVFNSCEKIFVLSDWTGRSVIDRYEQAPEKVITVGAGANVSTALPQRSSDLLAPKILFVGLDWEQKGGPLLLRAFRQVRAAVPGARLVIVGCSPRNLDLEPGIEVIGQLDRSKPAEEARLLEAYATATCFCIVPAVDAFPNVLLEASAFGVPVVSTDEGSRSEVVLDGVTGRLVPPGDPEKLAAAVIQLLSDPVLAAKLGEAAASQVRERFNWPAVSRTILKHMGFIDTSSLR